MSVVDHAVAQSIRAAIAAPPDFLEAIARRCRIDDSRCAVIDSNGRLTYGDLAARVAGLTRRLRAAGVTPGALVAICLPRGADELVAMLAVLTTGAAYVPLDPSHPPGRLAMIVGDSRPELLITHPRHPLGDHGVPTLLIGPGAVPISDTDESYWSPEADPDALAYVLFTSGSTGRPKGVEIPRRAVSNLLASMVITPGLRRSDVLLAVSTSMFDIAVLELFGPLCVGGTVRIADAEVVKDGRRLREVLDGEYVSVMQATPTLWHTLIDAGWTGDGNLRILVGGEALSPDLARQLLRRGEVWNMYGPTETTVWSTCKRVDDPDRITIGRPIANTEIYVLGEDGAVLGPGVTGELCIGGAGLARGYLGRPDLTAERFIQNPVGSAGRRIYRTGDLVRLLDDGELCYLGRADHQIKLRGFRIELGEVEHALTDLDVVSRAVVVPWEPIGGTTTLVAYVVPGQGGAVDPRDLSRLLRDRLPAHMVPGRFVAMAALPVTPNGKIDRAALPDPDLCDDGLHSAPRRTQPRTHTETVLHRIWSEVLNRRNVATDDDFFDLGGQSILAVRICDRIHRELMVDLAVSALMDHRNIAELAAYIDTIRNGSASQGWSSVVPIQTGGAAPAIFCVSGVGGNPMTFRELADALGRDQPFYGLQHHGVDGARRPHTSIESMAHAFVSDIRAVQPTGPYVLAGYSGGGLAAFEAARQLTSSGEEVPLLILLDTMRPGLSGWLPQQRARRHWAKLRTGGIDYLRRRVADRTTILADDISTRIRAGLARVSPYRFRLAAVEMAGRRAAAQYIPETYRGDVLLFQSDPEIGSEAGIPVRQHESNGWRDLIDGDLRVVRVRAGHFSLVEGDTAGIVAAEIRRALSAHTTTADRRKP